MNKSVIICTLTFCADYYPRAVGEFPDINCTFFYVHVLPHSSHMGGGQKVTAPPPYGRSARTPGVREEEQTYYIGCNI